MKRKSMKKNANLNYGMVTKEVIENYNSWLVYSNMTEDSLFEHRLLRPITISKEVLYNGAFSVQLFIENNAIGEPFISPSKELNHSFMIDVSFILLYIAERLDEANRKNPLSCFNNLDKDYYFRTIKDTVKQSLLVG